MTWLVLDTACPRAVVGVVRENRVLAEVFLHETMRHAEQLASAIEQCMQLASTRFDDLKGVGAGVGPGSFVGVRIAIAHAKGICVARKIPLVGIGTLHAIASASDLPDGEGFSVVDARRQELYMLRVLRETRADCLSVTPLSKAAALGESSPILLSSEVRFVAGFGAPNLVTHEMPGPTAFGMLQVLNARLGTEGAIDETATLEPNYCRNPDAKIPSF